MTTELAENIDWVGYVDWDVRDFHSFDTHHGATYNAYLIRDEKTAVIDAVKAPYVSNLLHNIADKTDLAKVDYVVCNHAEPDHAGGLGALLANLPNATLLCNAKCKDALGGYFDTANWKIQIVSPHDKIPLGRKTLSFLDTPMVHWPESMFTYIPEDQILFSMDAFGQHLATSERFDDQYDLHSILVEAKTYYANIVTPYGKQVQAVLKAAENIPIKMIAPSHGLIWRRYVSTIIGEYQNWAAGKYAPKLLILFDSMWGSTAQMADAVMRGATLESDKVSVQFLHVRKNTLTRIALEMLDASAVALGSPTMNMQMMPFLSGVLTYIRGLKCIPKTAMAFGSHGWAGAGSKHLDMWIEETGWLRLMPPIQSKFKPSCDILDKCEEAGRKLAQAALNAVSKAAES
ncbi:MAG: FprA family A-type flavoprotein [Planctomycetaceae bacterium]|jgi:flavorubredoxin|nr:FprA family A-type flavoprotein [Planctomycetaceae bacterium]